VLNGGHKVAEKTKESIQSGLLACEKRFDKERRSDEDRSVYYLISKDILAASPSLYGDFLGLLEGLEQKDLETFNEGCFPLYQALLTVYQKGRRDLGEPIYSGRDLLKIRKNIEGLKARIAEGVPPKDIFEAGRQDLIERIKQGFAKRFGIKKVPEHFDKERIRTVQDFIRYISNLAHKDDTKEALLAFYFSLCLNDEWHAFRAGKAVNVGDYLEDDKKEIVEAVLKQYSPDKIIMPSLLGIEENQIGAFREALETETVATTLGSIQTIDMKLGNAKRGIETLGDLDAYPEEKDKATLALCLKHHKAVGQALAELFGSLKSKKPISESSRLIAARLADIYGVDSWTAGEIKRVQDDVKVVSLIVDMLKKVEDEDIDRKIEELHAALEPSESVIRIFQKIGEEFERSSGALALSHDLAYLENIFVKNDDKLDDIEKKAAKDYIDGIRNLMTGLEGISMRVKEYFEKVAKSIHGAKKEILESRMEEIRKVLHATGEAMNITSTMTSNMNLLIEHMRQCLGCRTTEINNDTNLTFGEPYKFYLLSQTDDFSDSIADEIVSLLPVTFEDGKKGMAFVLDQLYGTKSSDVLASHIKTIEKKREGLKARFPDAHIPIVVSQAALRSVGLDGSLLMDRLNATGKKDIFLASDLSITIPVSALGEHYTEFGGGARSAGPRSVAALVIA